MSSTTRKVPVVYRPTVASNRPPPIQCRHPTASGGQCARATTNRPPDCGMHGGPPEPPVTARLLDGALLKRNTVAETHGANQDRPLDVSSLWEMAKIAQVRIDDRRNGHCRCREWLTGDTAATGPTGPLHPDGAITGGCAVHDEHHATPGGTFLAVANDAGYEESPMIAEARAVLRCGHRGRR